MLIACFIWIYRPTGITLTATMKSIHMLVTVFLTICQTSYFSNYDISCAYEMAVAIKFSCAAFVLVMHSEYIFSSINAAAGKID